jgi:hypothetical protein
MGTTTGPRGYEEMLKAAGTLIGRQKKPADLKPHQSAPLSTLEYLRVGIPGDS